MVALFTRLTFSEGNKRLENVTSFKWVHRRYQMLSCLDALLSAQSATEFVISLNRLNVGECAFWNTLATLKMRLRKSGIIDVLLPRKEN